MSHAHHANDLSDMPNTPHGTDGALDRMLRLGQKPKFTPAIFIHAGAGFHSHQNERVHLQACVAAAEMGMKFLKAGATATEAVEAALRILEDKEITNAGYGSNLSIDGTVECDATIVDHLGRSGACGAVPNIRNPISLAKLILDLSNKPLSLRRVPPNALVGQGAKNFAEEHGMATFGNEYLVSKNARDRFIRWQDDLKRAEGKAKESKPSANSEHGQAECSPCQYDTGPPLEAHRTYSRDHSAAVIAGPWNEGQPDSPYYGTPTPGSVAGSESPITANYFRSPVASVGVSTARSGRNGLSPSRSRGRSRRADLTTQAATSRSNALTPDEINQTYADAVLGFDTRRPKQANGYQTGLPFTERLANDFPQGVKRPNSQTDEGGVLDRHPTWRPFRHGADGEDQITDTIGAIAIDDKGHIAAGSSSGGIGMKHQGRLGPAALVGIGTAVVPFSEDDEEGITVAAVTSGTGEHMATTMASQRCAERIYRGVRKGVGGGEVQDDDEDAIMESFIADDFMNHPGVRNCHSAGAIGVMVVKKTRTGYYLYFAHNTDSFALASMGGTEKEPVCTMSRLSEGAEIARGGRKIRVD